MPVNASFEVEEGILFVDAEDDNHVYGIEMFGHAMVVRRDSKKLYEMYLLCKFGSMYHGIIHISNRAAPRGEKEVKDKHLLIDGDRAKVIDHLFVKCLQFRHLRYIEFEIIRDIFVTVQNLVTEDNR